MGATRSGHGGLVTVFGGSGFVGRHTVRALARQGWRVRAAVRRPDLAGHLQPMGNVGQIHAVQANLRYPDSVRAAVEGADAVVNLVAIMTPSGRQTFDAVHVKGAAAIARAATDAGVGQLVHISALGADPRSGAQYARTKGLGEKAMRDAFPDVVILRPSIVFGPEDDFFNRFAGMAALAPMLPLIGGGKTRFQPVFVGDLAEAIKNACAGAAAPGTVYEIGGPETYSFRQLWTTRRNGRDAIALYQPAVLVHEIGSGADLATARSLAAGNCRPGSDAAARQRAEPAGHRRSADDRALGVANASRSAPLCQPIWSVFARVASFRITAARA